MLDLSRHEVRCQAFSHVSCSEVRHETTNCRRATEARMDTTIARGRRQSKPKTIEAYFSMVQLAASSPSSKNSIFTGYLLPQPDTIHNSLQRRWPTAPSGIWLPTPAVTQGPASSHEDAKQQVDDHAQIHVGGRRHAGRAIERIEAVTQPENAARDDKDDRARPDDL